MDAELHRLVRDRSGRRCEYCRLPEAESLVPFEIEHIIPRKHRGQTVPGNLAWACIYCNGYKGPNLTGYDPATGKVTVLYHPRRHKWGYHFRYQGATLIGRTAIGRTTIDVLQINRRYLVAIREVLIAAGVF